MKPRRRLRSCLFLIAAAAALSGSALSHAASTTRLTADVVHNLSLAQPLGAVPATQQITVGLVLQNPNEAAEDAYLSSLYDPSSSNYQQFLDPDVFNQKFGVSDTDLQAAQAWLASGGLQVTAIDGARNFLAASGSAAQAAALFQTTLGQYSSNGHSFYANSLAPAVPSTLPVLTVLGLNDFNRFSTPRVSGPTGPALVTTAPIGTVPVTGLLSPRALWSIYDMPATNLGNGQSMAIFGWGTTPDTVNHLRSFEHEFQLPQAPVSIQYYGDQSTPILDDVPAQTEWDLDTQASTGMAPNVVSETLYFARHNTDADVYASWVAWVNDKKGPLQASASYGECENIPGTSAVVADGLETPGDRLLKQAAIEGRTLFSSTGDTGSSCPIVPVGTNGVATQVYPGLNYPSASPYAVAVGGTDLNGDGGNPQQRLTETAWEFTGGGNSVAEPAASYQAGVAPVKCVFDQSGNPTASGTTCRGTPDVAAISGDVATGNGMMITDANGVDQQGAGTSLSSPLMLGMWTRIQAAASKKGLGFANYSFYKLGQGSSYSSDFFDVTIGDNQPYAALPGWDNVSGWGVPDIGHVMKDLTGRLTPVKTTAPAPVSPTPQVSCGSLFTDPSGDDVFVYQGQSFGAQGAQPQLDILGAQLLLTPDKQTLKTFITVRNLSTVIPTGGGENTYNVVWSLNGLQFFTQLAVAPGGLVSAYDGEVVHLPVLTKYQQLHVDTGKLTPGPNGTIEVDVPVANLGGLALGQVLQQPNATANVRMVAPVGGLFATIDSGGPNADYVVATC